MNKDLVDDVRDAVEEYYRANPEADYIIASVITAFAKFLHSRRWYSTDDIILEMREMLLLECGDFRGDLDEFLPAR